MPAGSRLLLILSLPLLLPWFTGCGGRRNQELLENELRARDFQYREALEEMRRAEGRNDSLLREIEALRKGSKLPPEQAGQLYGLRKILLGRGTGGEDRDGIPGDEALSVFVEPRDSDDHTVKMPGKLTITALEINFQGVKVPLCSWDISQEQLRQSWKQGLLSTGYHLILPWKVFPKEENVRVVAQVVLPDGRVFEADKDIRVRVVPGKARRMEEGPPPNLLPQETPSTTPPADDGDPFALPSGKLTPAGWQRTVHRPKVTPLPTQWEPVPLRKSIQIGRPEPFAAPGPPRLEN